jgi:hypothetical protein
MQIKTAFAQLALSDDKVLNNIAREADKQSVDALRPLPRLNPRFQAKWVNGIWTIFDRWTFTNREAGLPTEKATLALLA